MNMAPEKIVQLTDRDHILLRPGMYIGGTQETAVRDFFLEGDKFIYVTKSYVPGLIKIIFEPIDNSVDVAIKSNFKYANKISVTVTDTEVKVVDNGYGISQDVDEATGISSVVLAVGNARSGSNFDESTDRNHIGMYGVGVCLTNVFSKRFVCDTFDGKRETIVEFINNRESYKISTSPKRAKPGTSISFVPDLERFGMSIIDEVHKNIIKQRLFILAVSYPEIEFTFNGEKIKMKNQKAFADMFGSNYEIVTYENGFIAYYPSVSDEFNHYTIINGQIAKKGGTHVNYINLKVVNFLRDSMAKKYKDIKLSDVRNKLMMVALFRNFPNPEYNGQVKEEFASSASAIAAYLKEVDFAAFSKRVYKNKEIYYLIAEMYRIREEFQKQKDMESLSKKRPKPKSDKYFPPIGDRKHLFIVEGDSALGGLANELGRKGRGYFAIRGKLLNVLEAKSEKIVSNIEIKTIKDILEADVLTWKLNPRAKYRRMTDIVTGLSYIVSDDDTFRTDNGRWLNISLLDRGRFTFGDIMCQEFTAEEYFRQPRVNQRYSCSYEDVVLSTDADFDGSHIRGLCLTLFDTLMLPIFKAGRIKYLRTPLVTLKKGDKILKYFFTFEEYQAYLAEHPRVSGEWKYYKGLGSWADGELKGIIDKEGLDRFLVTFDYTEDTHEILVNWMSKETSDFRKEMIKALQLSQDEA